MNTETKLNRSTFVQHTRIRSFAIAGASLALAGCLLAPAIAYADVRETDLVMGESVSSRNLDQDQCPDIAAEYACVVAQDGTVYFQREADASAQIASITKVMTAIVALDTVPVDFVVTVSDTAADIGESSAKLEAWDTMTRDEALKALLIPSGNDAAQAIAESVGGYILGSTDNPDASCVAFVDAMNKKAAEIGMANTLFTNPHGLDDDGFESDQHSTAADIACLSAYAMKDDTFRSIASNQDRTCTVSRDGEEKSIELEPTDALIGEYTGACGIKTGFTDTAGGCFAGACNRDDADLYSVVLKSSDEESRFDDTVALWDWVYDNTVEYPLASSSEFTADEKTGSKVPIVAKVSAASWMDRTVLATLEDPDQTVAVFSPLGDVTQSVEYLNLEGTIKAGDKVGTVTYTQDDSVLATANLVATETVQGPSAFDKVVIWFKRMIGTLNGTPRQAESEFLNDTMQVSDKLSSK